VIGSDQRPTTYSGNKKWPLWFWAACLFAPLIFIGGMSQIENQHELDEQYRLNTARYVASNAATPPADSANWQQIDLAGRLGPNDSPTSIWLRIKLPATNSAEHRWMLFMPNPRSTNVSLWLDNLRYEGAGAHHSPPLTMPRNPVSLPFSALALPKNDRELFLHLSRDSGGVPVSELYLGPYNELEDYVAQSVFAKQSLLRAILVMMMVMAFITLIIHFMQREETSIYGWWTIALGVALLYTAHSQLEQVSFGSLWFWWGTTYVTLALFTVSNAIFVNRLIGSPQPVVERVFVAVLIAGSAFILSDPFGPERQSYFVSLFWIPCTLAVGLYVFARLWRSAMRMADKDVLLLLATTFVGICVGVRDFLYNDLGVVSGSMLYMRHCTGLMVVAYSFVMISRFSRLPRSHRKTLGNPDAHTNPLLTIDGALDHRSLLEQEHNAIEAQLQEAILHFEPSEETSQLSTNLRAARHDLQLIRDSIMRADEGKTDVIANMQQRLSQSAQRQSTPFIWLTPHQDPLWPQDAHHELAIARFLQTAIVEAMIDRLKCAWRGYAPRRQHPIPSRASPSTRRPAAISMGSFQAELSTPAHWK